MATPTLPMLILALTVKFRDLIKQLREQNQRPVKLLVIDALTELFHSDKRTTTNTLVQRSKDLAQISALLHSIASEHQIAVLVLNEVVDVVDQGPSAGPADQNDLIYREQARWFNRADSIPGEDRKEAGLALVWANQVNARIMCTRTNRYRNLYDFADKRSRGDASASVSHREPASDSSTLIRRLSVIFSSVSSPASVDYIVTAAGIATVDEIVSMSSNICISKKRPAVLMEETAVPEAPSQGLTTQELPEELGEPDAQSDGGANSDDLYAELDLALLDAADAEDSVLS
ncbi:hypothetical protein OE88DRAFT_1654094 [Heliocybe sulcata]|uniref:RecA family profile 1 domain-containing protein n=1 Tax=Heliocybe sulcata TaxID=5364 RepID=A0A5C3NNS7_9AGAM|nr:hypothetical protein OE88DRAFT_1654094 [Heliocybe sulcata]